MPSVGIDGRDMGDSIISNLSKFSFPRAFAPLIQIGGANFFTVLGDAKTRLRVHQGKVRRFLTQLEKRKMIWLSTTLDARWAEFSDLEIFYTSVSKIHDHNQLKKYLENPSSML